MIPKELKSKNIRGVEDFPLLPAGLTVISGANGVGKSSIIAAVTYLGEKSHDPSMLRIGTAKGDISLTIGDESGEFDGAQFNCVVTAEKTTRILVHPKLGKIPVSKSKEWLEGGV